MQGLTAPQQSVAPYRLPAGPLLLGALLCLSALPFIPFLSLPPISDDYSQWYFARRYISLSGLRELATDVLYRSRLTSLLFTRLIDALFGLSQPAHLAAGILIHSLNSLLLYYLARALKFSPLTAALAAAVFACYSGHQEAIVWVASQHELFVFAFAAATTLCWLRWLAAPRLSWALAAAAAYLAALYSKESAVVLLPLLAALWLLHKPGARAPLFFLGALSLFTLLYTLAIFQSSATHLHLNDGTFSWRAPFWLTLPASLARLLWPAGLIALAILLPFAHPRARLLALAALLWSTLALLPYVFLTYQTRVPSRHTYLASAGLALIIALALSHIATLRPAFSRRAVPALLLLFVAANLANLWLRKRPQFLQRALATQRYLLFAAQHPGPIAIGPAPFPITVYQHSVAVVFGRDPMSVQKLRPSLDPQSSLFTDKVHP